MNASLTVSTISRIMTATSERLQLRQHRRALQEEIKRLKAQIQEKESQCEQLQRKEDDLDDEWSRHIVSLISQHNFQSQVSNAEESHQHMLEMCAVPAASDHSELTCAGMEDAPLGSLDDSLIELLLVNAQSSIETQPADNSGKCFTESFAMGVGECSKPKKRKQVKKLTLDELRGYLSSLTQYWDKKSKGFRCPVADCGTVLEQITPSKAFRHLLDHLGEESRLPYKCPMDGCGYVSVYQESIRSHVKGFHKAEWTEELKKSSVHAENKALIDAIYEEAIREWSI